MLPLLQGLLETVDLSSEPFLSRLVCLEYETVGAKLASFEERSTWRTATDSTTVTEGFAQSGRTPRPDADVTGLCSSTADPLLSLEARRLTTGGTFSRDAEVVGLH